MTKTVVGVFSSHDQAEQAVAEMRKSGFDTNEISIVAKGQQETNENMDAQGDTSLGMGGVSDGVTAGGALGGLAGLAMGAGALTIPGLGPIIAAGPIAGLLSGAATGGVAGGLLDMGIPQERGQHYESEVKSGNILAAVKTQEQKVQKAADILRSYGAKDVETHSRGI